MAGQQIEAADVHHAVDAIDAARDAGQLRHGRVRAFQRRGWRKRYDGDQVALVLRRDQAGRTRGNQTPDHGQQCHEGERDQHRVAAQNQNRSQIAGAEVFEQPIESIEESRQRPSPGPIRSGRFQQQRAHGGRKGQRANRREDHRHGERQCELLVELAGQASQERDRHEHGRQHQRDGDDRRADVGHRRLGGLQR